MKELVAYRKVHKTSTNGIDGCLGVNIPIDMARFLRIKKGDVLKFYLKDEEFTMHRVSD